jgi:2-polyprenyl-6-methoxyphenol hydroxylase-like FAD-dependent oxidoreductase
MAPPFAALLSATSQQTLFVTKVNDALCATASFHDGRVLLVGDALAAFRPHFAVATEQAARQCLALGRVWQGELGGLGEWEREVTGYGERMFLASRVLGAFGLGRWWELVKGVGVFVGFLVRGRVRGWGVYLVGVLMVLLCMCW